ncbi:DNA methyltransferase [Thermoleophilum album]|uniref:Adenine-specific DNA-methyltransferase n=1 Tax=Thermoleophilum album TaxID=29539 RepID=A0A1H6FSR9_THEAL|nr:DNA methyltransferase [Thermoleophilum album]SEH13889.1 adenine-specific DNA-methyltransferase [Thermoleophilum album]
MAKIEITKTELVWPGKYNEDGTLKEVPRVSLPFQVIERVNESRATRESKKGGVQQTLFDVWEGKEGETFEEGWRNKLIWGDNLLVMGSLLEKFAGKIDLIYIDPPFATGADFSFTAPIGEEGEEVYKEQSVLEEKAYRDTWGRGIQSYLSTIYDRLVVMRELLSEHGTIYVHLGYKIMHYVKLMMDEIFGTENFVNQIIWFYPDTPGRTEKRFNAKHDVILCYSNTTNYAFYANSVREEILLESKERYKSPRVLGGRSYVGGKSAEIGKVPEDVWRIPAVKGTTVEHMAFPTQKPERLLERIILASSNPGDLVADFFCGSGTTLAVAEKLGRRWIGCDLSRWAIHVTRKRLLDIPNCKPFEVLNLGKYERQYWQGVTFGDKKDKSVAERALYEYLAFILKLYGAQPVAGMAHLHGKKGKAMVHIGAVDAPVTIDEIEQALNECVALKQSELHVLGWEWEMGLAGPNNDRRRGGVMHEVARQRGVKLLLLQIPREVMEEQAAAKGDVKFFELAYFGVDILRPKPRTVAIRLTDFASPNMDELIPEDIRAKIKKWSDYIDYWAVDWDFQNDTFMQGWVAYRTRKERKLPLASDPHTYEKPGTYRVLVKVVDIFGNDTSQAYDVEVT